MARYSQLITQKIVPEEVRQIIHILCERWDEGYGYEGKKYTENEPYQLQLLINSNLGEAAIFGLLKQPEFIAEVDALLAKHPELPNNHIGTQGNYRFNNATGYQKDEDHDILDASLPSPDKKGWSDLIYYGQFDETAVWSVEVKNTVSYSTRNPANFHGADLVFVLFNDTGLVEVYAPTINRRINKRTDACYIKLGALSVSVLPGYKKVSETWQITDF